MSRIWTPPIQEGLLQGKRIILPRFVREMTQTDRRFWALERGIKEFFSATSYNTVETLNSMVAAPAAVGPTASLLSILPRDCLEAVQPSYFRAAGNRFKVHAYGNVLTTATVPTYQLQVVIGPTLANPLTAAQMLAQNVAITPAASLTGTLEYFLDVTIVVRAIGISGSLEAYGTLFNDWVTALTFVQTTMKNAIQSAPVVMTGAGGLLVPLYIDLEVIMGAATSGNTINALDYELLSMN